MNKSPDPKTTPPQVPCLESLLEYAVRAPSTHNTQPWLFKIAKNSCVVMPDLNYRLPEADPTGRDLYISLGCCVENLLMAATAHGLTSRISYRSKPTGELQIQVNFSGLNHPLGHKANQKILSAIQNRVNARGRFESQPLAKGVLKNLVDLTRPTVEAKTVTDKTQIQQLAKHTAQGIKEAYRRPRFRREFSHWLNSNVSSRREGIPGYALKLPTWLSIILPPAVRWLNLGSRLARLNYGTIVSAPAAVILAAEGDNPKTWIEVGRTAQRIMIDLYAQDIKSSIFVAAIESSRLRPHIQEVIGSLHPPQFLFCVGYMAGHFPLTPRIPLKHKIVKTS